MGGSRGGQWGAVLGVLLPPLPSAAAPCPLPPAPQPSRPTSAPPQPLFFCLFAMPRGRMRRSRCQGAACPWGGGSGARYPHGRLKARLFFSYFIYFSGCFSLILPEGKPGASDLVGQAGGSRRHPFCRYPVSRELPPALPPRRVPPVRAAAPALPFSPFYFQPSDVSGSAFSAPFFVRKSVCSCKFVTRWAPGSAARCHSQILARPPLKLQPRAVLPRWVFSPRVPPLQEDERLPWLDFEGWAGPCCAASCGCACGTRLQSSVLRGARQ